MDKLSSKKIDEFKETDFIYLKCGEKIIEKIKNYKVMQLNLSLTDLLNEISKEQREEIKINDTVEYIIDIFNTLIFNDQPLFSLIGYKQNPNYKYDILLYFTINFTIFDQIINN